MVKRERHFCHHRVGDVVVGQRAVARPERRIEPFGDDVPLPCRVADVGVVRRHLVAAPHDVAVVDDHVVDFHAVVAVDDDHVGGVDHLRRAARAHAQMTNDAVVKPPSEHERPIDPTQLHPARAGLGRDGHVAVGLAQNDVALELDRAAHVEHDDTRSGLGARVAQAAGTVVRQARDAYDATTATAGCAGAKPLGGGECPVRWWRALATTAVALATGRVRARSIGVRAHCAVGFRVVRRAGGASSQREANEQRSEPDDRFRFHRSSVSTERTPEERRARQRSQMTRQ